MCKYKFRRQFLQTAVPLLLTVSMMLTGCGQTGNSNSPVRPILPDNSPDSSTVSSGEKLPDPVTIVGLTGWRATLYSPQAEPSTGDFWT